MRRPSTNAGLSFVEWFDARARLTSVRRSVFLFYDGRYHTRVCKVGGLKLTAAISRCRRKSNGGCYGKLET